jgi:hypothetical protein
MLRAFEQGGTWGLGFSGPTVIKLLSILEEISKSENGRVGNILDLDNILRHKYVRT